MSVGERGRVEHTRRATHASQPASQWLARDRAAWSRRISHMPLFGIGFSKKAVETRKGAWPQKPKLQLVGCGKNPTHAVYHALHTLQERSHSTLNLTLYRPTREETVSHSGVRCAPRCCHRGAHRCAEYAVAPCPCARGAGSTPPRKVQFSSECSNPCASLKRWRSTPSM